MELFLLVSSKVNGIVNRIKEDRIEEFYFKNAVPDGYRLKLIKDSTIVDNVYLTTSEAENLLKQLHIKTDSLLFNVFQLDLEKEATVKIIISSVHELGIINSVITSVNATEEDLIQALNHLATITKDVDLAELDVKQIQKEELYNILHNKHLEYYSKYTDFLLTEAIS